MPVNPEVLGPQFNANASANLNLGTSSYRPGGKVERLGPEKKDDAPDVPDVPDVAPAAAGEGAAGAVEGAGAAGAAGAEAATGVGGLVEALGPLLLL